MKVYVIYVIYLKKYSVINILVCCFNYKYNIYIYWANTFTEPYFIPVSSWFSLDCIGLRYSAVMAIKNENSICFITLNHNKNKSGIWYTEAAVHRYSYIWTGKHLG